MFQSLRIRITDKLLHLAISFDQGLNIRPPGYREPVVAIQCGRTTECGLGNHSVIRGVLCWSSKCCENPRRSFPKTSRHARRGAVQY